MHFSSKLMILPGKLAKSTRMPCSFFKLWKSSSLTSSVCKKVRSLSLERVMRSICRHNHQWQHVLAKGHAPLAWRKTWQRHVHVLVCASAVATLGFGLAARYSKHTHHSPPSGYGSAVLLR